MLYLVPQTLDQCLFEVGLFFNDLDRIILNTIRCEYDECCIYCGYWIKNLKVIASLVPPLAGRVQTLPSCPFRQLVASYTRYSNIPYSHAC